MFSKRFEKTRSADKLFEQANYHWRRMRDFIGADEYQLCVELTKVVEFCQLSIQQDAKCGNAYVLLANALTSASSHGPGKNDLTRYDHLQSLAAGVIHLWYTLPHREYPITSRNNKEIGDRLWGIIVNDVKNDKQISEDAAIKLIEVYRDTLATKTISPNSYDVIQKTILVKQKPAIVEETVVLIENILPADLQQLLTKILRWATQDTQQPVQDRYARLTTEIQDLRDSTKIPLALIVLFEHLESAHHQKRFRDAVDWIVWLLLLADYQKKVVDKGLSDSSLRESEILRSDKIIESQLSILQSTLAESRSEKDWVAMVLTASVYLWLNVAPVTDDIIRVLKQEIGENGIRVQLNKILQHPQSLIEKSFAKSLQKYLGLT